MRTNLLILLILLAITACAPHQPTLNEYQIAQAQAAAQEACYDAQERAARAESLDIASLPPEERASVTLISLLQRNTVALVAAATGHSADPCQATNYFDEQIAEVKAKNQALSAAWHDAVGIAPWGFGYATLKSAFSAAGDTHSTSTSADEGSTINYDSGNVNLSDYSKYESWSRNPTVDLDLELDSPVPQ